MKEVTAAIIIDNNKILIAQRGKNENLAGKWEFPGGKIEIDEYVDTLREQKGMSIDALFREVYRV